MAYKAVLFDLDGTLLDTLADFGLSANRMLEEADFPVHPLESYRYFVGAGAHNLVSRILPETARNEATIDDCLQKFLKIYDSSWSDNTQPYPGIPEMLDYLQERNYRLAILSNKPQDFTELCVSEFLSDWNFEEVWGKREGFDLKPSPKAALKIAGIMGLESSAYYYLGDTKIDMETATNAGMYSIGVTWGFRPREELLDAGAKILLDKPMDITTYLK